MIFVRRRAYQSWPLAPVDVLARVEVRLAGLDGHLGAARTYGDSSMAMDVPRSAGAPGLCLERPLVVVDTETTGTDPQTDRIVQIALTRVAADGHVDAFASFVNPGIAISEAATAVHGITAASQSRDRPILFGDRSAGARVHRGGGPRRV